MKMKDFLKSLDKSISSYVDLEILFEQGDHNGEIFVFSVDDKDIIQPNRRITPS